MNKSISDAADLLLDLFFPNRCPGCDRVIGRDIVFCPDCEPELEYLEPLPWQSFFPDTIGDEGVFFDEANALFYHEGTARASVLSLKYGSALSFAEYSAERMALKIDDERSANADIVTSVPMNKRKRGSRGYDQAEVYSRALARQLGKPYSGDLLVHRFKRRSQHELTASERFIEAESVYHVNEKARSLDGKNVLLCDDIFTTGATVNICAKLLKELGAGEVYVSVICLRKKNAR